MSQAQKKLDYDILPKPHIQSMYLQLNCVLEKLKVLLNPYNKSAFHQKHMYFDNDKKPNSITGKEEEGLQWKRLFNLIINERKTDMRKFLTQINKRFYANIARKALKQKNTMYKRNKRDKNKQNIDKNIFPCFVQIN